MALALRFDVSRGKDSQYFKSAFFGYAFGVVLTIVVMNWFQAAQVSLSILRILLQTFFLSSHIVLVNLIICAVSFSACTFVYCTGCYRLFGRSLPIEWRR